MKYLQGSFTIPASNGKITQEEWDRIFRPAELIGQEYRWCEKLQKWVPAKYDDGA